MHIKQVLTHRHIVDHFSTEHLPEKYTTTTRVPYSYQLPHTITTREHDVTSTPPFNHKFDKEAHITIRHKL
jgi:hypothetical protein